MHNVTDDRQTDGRNIVAWFRGVLRHHQPGNGSTYSTDLVTKSEGSVIHSKFSSFGLSQILLESNKKVINLTTRDLLKSTY